VEHRNSEGGREEPRVTTKERGGQPTWIMVRGGGGAGRGHQGDYNGRCLRTFLKQSTPGGERRKVEKAKKQRRRDKRREGAIQILKRKVRENNPKRGFKISRKKKNKARPVDTSLLKGKAEEASNKSACWFILVREKRERGGHQGR